MNNLTSPVSSYPVEYMVTEQDALGYIRQCWMASAVLLLSYGLAVQGILPIAGLVLVVILALPRWIISIHELMHIYDDQQISRWVGLMGVSPVPLSVLTLSYSQLRAIHWEHHLDPASPADPDAYHIRGPVWWAFLNALTVPEQSVIRWLTTRGLSVSLTLDLVIKAVLLGAIAWWGGATFWWFWVTLRLVYGIADFAFFRCVHHHQGEYGTFGLSLPAVWVRLGEGVFGKTVVHATLNHDLHHQAPGLAARSLSLARQHHLT
jgi:fatty acid desaturase